MPDSEWGVSLSSRGVWVSNFDTLIFGQVDDSSAELGDVGLRLGGIELVWD